MRKRPAGMRRSIAIVCCILVLMLAMAAVASAKEGGGLFRIFVNGNETGQQEITYEKGDKIVVEGDDVRTEMESEGAGGEMKVDENGDVEVKIEKTE